MMVNFMTILDSKNYLNNIF